MSFIIFKKEITENKVFYKNLEEFYSLAGNKNGLIYKIWDKKGKKEPKKQEGKYEYIGWTINANDLLKYEGVQKKLTSKTIIKKIDSLHATIETNYMGMEIYQV